MCKLVAWTVVAAAWRSQPAPAPSPDSFRMRPPTVNALLTDLYELNMAASYLRRGMTGTATFSLFVRSLPAMRGFLVAAGVESCLDLLADFRFEEEDIRYLRETQGYAEGDLEAFRKLRFTGDVCAIFEGCIALAGESILEVTALLPEV